MWLEGGQLGLYLAIFHDFFHILTGLGHHIPQLWVVCASLVTEVSPNMGQHATRTTVTQVWLEGGQLPYIDMFKALYTQNWKNPKNFFLKADRVSKIFFPGVRRKGL